jgi:predicted transposase/invertase (TIGR01784 family)
MTENLPRDRYDTTIKELFGDGEEELISFFGHLKTKVIQHLNIEFARVEKKRSDLILECRTEFGPAAVHLEFQCTNDSDIPFRMLRYATELQQKYRLPVYQILIYFGEREMAMADGLEYSFGPQNHLDYRYMTVDLGSISREEIKKTNNYTLYALLPLADRTRRKQHPEAFLRECVLDILQASVTTEEKRKTLLRAEIFAGLYFEEKIIEQIFREVETMLNIEESAGYQRIFKKGVEKGIQQGMEKGMEKGRQDTLRENVLKLLHKKFKKIPRPYVDKIKTLDEYALGLILDNIFEINTLSDLEEYL